MKLFYQLLLKTSQTIINLIINIYNFLLSIIEILKMILQISLYGSKVIFRPLDRLTKSLFNIENNIDHISQLFDKNTNNINTFEIINISIKNMKTKKARLYITITGMTIGISTIVLLLSIGYGLQSLIVNRVATLEEIKQLDVTTAPGSNLIINADNLEVFTQIFQVEKVLPQISVVGKVNFNNATADMAVYGVKSDYLTLSSSTPILGGVFKDEDRFYDQRPTSEIITSDALKIEPINRPGDVIEKVMILPKNNDWIEVKANYDHQASVIGYISRQVGELSAELVWGDEALEKWIKASFPLWQKTEQGYQPLLEENGTQQIKIGFIPENLMQTNSRSNILNNDNMPTQELEGDWILVEGISDTFEKVHTTQVSLPNDITNLQAVVNRSFLEIFNINEDQAIGLEFEASFIATGKLFGTSNQRIESEPITYQIVGITPDGRTPLFYIPLEHLYLLGIENYSQVKLVLDSPNSLAETRRIIESNGYNTSSVADTVDQINNLFGNLRIFLAIVGSIALLIAALGMFNTLTISLLERTKEVGLLKAMGMKSSDVKKLFLAESMIMGSLGGFLGILFGLLLGKSIELAISAYSINKGAGYINIIDIPIEFALLIIFISFLVGVVTGIYPALRATKISALNALRYE